KAIIPKDKHVQSKAETFTVEGYNSLFRHFLARMRRKSKCYSNKYQNARIIHVIINALSK
ncbi:IS1 family transposase, partial [Tenacibaculum finnmarkense]|nr:IS1 family transposase [Tenacibaculum finnmarkense genomovar finnmarkense]MCG8723072.1 IS1 family transposase [Tenacibaculum finnmarkense]MCG8741276.1 IS1 family transposase [Tenacibaculum finnmarkense]MCG8764683.1 IS1 family transposase [Tenacibaculum finnmarkense]MCG8777542.1 IS1 family transposase [Tenacibaculum finnmarkense]